MLSVPQDFGAVKLVFLCFPVSLLICYKNDFLSFILSVFSFSFPIICFGIIDIFAHFVFVYPQEVYDHDTFSADDIMGEAEVDIQPMITSAMAFGDAGMFGNMQIGKWLKSNDNALTEDSTVNIIDGKVKQEVSLKLQNVESGEISLDIEWIPLDQ